MGMSDKKIQLVLTKYELRFEDILKASDDALSDAGVHRVHMEHAKQMIPKMRQFLVEKRREKVFRWLGFLQGVLYCNGIYTIEEMANHNRPTKEEMKEQNPGHSFGRYNTCPPCGDLDGCHLWSEYAEAPDA